MLKHITLRKPVTIGAVTVTEIGAPEKQFGEDKIPARTLEAGWLWYTGSGNPYVEQLVALWKAEVDWIENRYIREALF